MSIRTTVTLDEDVLDRIKGESRVRGASFRDTLNDLLRVALLQLQTTKPRSRFVVKPTAMGVKTGLNYDSIESLIAYGEGEAHR